MDQPPQPSPALSRPLGRRRLLQAGAAAVLATAGVTTALALRDDDQPAGGPPGGAQPTDGGAPPVDPAATGRRLGHPFWSTPLPADAAVAATSADYVARLAFQAAMGQETRPVALPYSYPFNIGISTTDYSVCIYVMPSDWPLTKVWSNREKTGLQEVLDRGVPVPDPADLPDGNVAPSGTDGSIIIIQGDQLWELWQFQPGGPEGYPWSCEQAGHMADHDQHPGWWAGSAAFGGDQDGRVLGYDWGVSASGQSYLGGILTAEDFFADVISHPLPLALPITGEGSSTPPRLLPATRYDQLNLTYAPDEVADAYRLPEGARFRLPPSFDIDGWVSTHAQPAADETGSTAPVLAKILRCLRDHGLIVVESAGIVGFSGEHEKVFGTRYHPYGADQRPQWGNFGQQLPWTALVQLEPPTTDISVPGSGGT